MIKTFDFSDLLPKQAELDEFIFSENHVDRDSTKRQRLLALLTEVLELANATRCFKFWSKRGSEPKERIVDEFADGLHFFLSLFIDRNLVPQGAYETVKESALTEKFLEVLNQISTLSRTSTDTDLAKAFTAFITLGDMLGLTPDEVRRGYLLKWKENVRRQQNNY